MTISAVTKYYTHGGQKVAMRQGEEVYYLHGDHLGSTSLTTDSSGAVVSEVRYLPYGEERWTSGETPTDFGFTAQRNEASFGLMDYQARFYSPTIGRFVSPDTLVPDEQNPQHWNRYSYVYNNPLKFTDPAGHCGGSDDGSGDLQEELVDDVCSGGGSSGSGGSRGGGGGSGNVSGSSSGRVSTGGRGGGRGGSGGRGPTNSGSDNVDDLVRQAQDAQRQAENLRQQHNVGDKTVAVSGNGQQTLSGWNHKNPNFTQVDVDDVLARGTELNHKFPSMGYRDRGGAGRWSASHAEKQMSILEPNQPVGIAGRNMCTNCQRYFQKVAVDTGRIQVVADRQVTRIFFPDGRKTLRFPD